jgi:hypothetical protein
VVVFVVVRDGCIRVGAQPRGEQPFIRTAPAKYAKSLLRTAIRTNFRTTNSHFLDKEAVDRLKQELLSCLVTHLVQGTNSRVVIVDDYTGQDTSFTTGADRGSMEAKYHFAVARDSGKILYHTPVNVCVTTASFNWPGGANPSSSCLLLAIG